MTPADVISTLSARGVKLWQEGGTLRYRARTGTLTEQERATLRAHKATILQALASTTASFGDEAVAGSTAVTAALPTYTESPEPEPKERLCYQCQHFARSPYGYPLGLCGAWESHPAPYQRADALRLWHLRAEGGAIMSEAVTEFWRSFRVSKFTVECIVTLVAGKPVSSRFEWEPYYPGVLVGQAFRQHRQRRNACFAALAAWAQEVVADLDSYTEVSPSDY